MEMRNVTIGGNVTELQELVTYDITQLRMDPDYIRSQNYAEFAVKILFVQSFQDFSFNSLETYLEKRSSADPPVGIASNELDLYALWELFALYF